MSIILFAILFLVVFAFGIAGGLLTTGAILRNDVLEGTGTYITYNEIRKRWEIYGDPWQVLNKVAASNEAPFRYTRQDALAESKVKLKTRFKNAIKRPFKRE